MPWPLNVSVNLGTLIAGIIAAAALGNMSRLLGIAKTHFYTGKDSISIRTKAGKLESLESLCRSVIPRCRLNPFLFNGHLQTMWTVIKSEQLVPIYYKRKVFEQHDKAYPGQFTVDFVVKPYQDADTTLPPRTTYYTKDEFQKIGSNDSRPMIIALHGLSGGSYELYLRHVLAPLVTEEGGWEACVVNSRGCANSRITTPVLFNARSTWDVRQTIRWLRETFPNRPLFAVGFSLGANILTNYLGEEGDKCILTAAVALSCPWSLDVSNMALQRSWFKRSIYSRAMGTNLKKLYSRHKDMILQNPYIEDGDVEKVRFLHEFDRVIQTKTWGYSTEQSYYRDASSTDSVFAVRIPFLAISAQDDPIVCDEAIPRQEFLQSRYGVLCTTSLGGHLSWFELGGGRWMAKATTAFFQTFARDVDLEYMAKYHPMSEDEVRPKHMQRQPLKPWWDPMRRKMHVASEMPNGSIQPVE